MQSLPCPLNCGIHGLRPADLVHHVRNECTHRTTPCHACGAVVKSKDLERHLRERCSIQQGSTWSPDQYRPPSSRSPMTRSSLSPPPMVQPRMHSSRAPPPSTRSDYTQRSFPEMPAAPWAPQSQLLQHGSPYSHQPGSYTPDSDPYAPEHGLAFNPALTTQRSLVGTARLAPPAVGTSELHAEVAQLRSELAAQHSYSERLATELMVLRADLCGVQAQSTGLSPSLGSPMGSPSIVGQHSNGIGVNMPRLPDLDKTETERRIQEYVDTIFQTDSQPGKAPASSRSRGSHTVARKPGAKSRAQSRASSVASEPVEYLEDDDAFKPDIYNPVDSPPTETGLGKLSPRSDTPPFGGTDSEEEDGSGVGGEKKVSANEAAVAELMKSMGGGAALLAASDSDSE